MHNRRKRPQIKNPFDMQEEQDDETIPIHQANNNQTQPKVHNPLPFNPYVIENDSNKKQNNQKQQPKIIPTQNIRQQPQPFIPLSQPTQRRKPASQKVYQLNQDGDPPLLQDIGIDPQMIKQRIFLVLRAGRPTQEMIQDPDLSGPTLIALCFGLLLLFSGKVHFGDIYAIFIVGNIVMYFLFNCMSQVDIIPLYNVMSTVGYSLLPMLILGIFSIFVPLKQTIGILLSLGIALWSSIAASNIMQCLMRQTRNDRKILLIYPLFLFYLSFAMIVIF